MTVYGDKTSMATRPATISTRANGSAGAAAGAPHRIGYGEHVVFGLYSLVTVYQGDLVVLYEIERGPIDSYVSIELGGVDMPVAGGTVSGIYLEAPKKGESAQVVSALLHTIFADHVERYPSHAYLVARFDADAIVGGSIPECRCVVKGRKDVYDPRTTTTGYTDTPALCTAHLVAAPEGGQAGSGGIVWDSVEDVADFQEATISGAKRYAIAGLISTRGMISQHVRAILSQSATWESRDAAGLWRIGCESAAATAVATITAAWLYWADGKKLPREWSTSADEQTTRQIVTFSDASRDWETAEAIAEVVGVAAGTQPLYQKTLEAPWISSREVAQRLADDTLALAQACYRVQFACNLKALALEQGDVVATSGVFGVPDGSWTVLSAQLSIRDGVTLTLSQRPGNSIAAPASEGKTTPPVPRVGEIPPAPTGLTLSVLESAAAGKVVYTIVAEVDPPASVIVRTLVFQLYEGGGWRTVATQDAASDRVARFQAAGPGDNDVRVWAISHSGQWSATAASDTVTCGPGVGAYPAVVLDNGSYRAYAGPITEGGGERYTRRETIVNFALESDPTGITDSIEIESPVGRLLWKGPPTATSVTFRTGGWAPNSTPPAHLVHESFDTGDFEIFAIAHDGTRTPSTGTASWFAQADLYELAAPAGSNRLAMFGAPSGGGLIQEVGSADPAAGEVPVFDGTDWGYGAVGAAGTIIVRSDAVSWVAITTTPGDKMEVALPAVTIPAGLTVRAAYLEFKGRYKNGNATNRYLIAGTLSLKKGSGSYTNFLSLAGAANSLGVISAGEIRSPGWCEGNVTSIVDGSGTYTAKLAGMDSSGDDLHVEGYWELGVVVTS